MSINNRLINTGGAGGPLQAILVVSKDDVKAISTADPSNLSVLDTVGFSGGSTNWRGGIALDVENQNAFIVNDQEKIMALNYSDPSNLSVLGAPTFGDSSSHNSSVALDLVNNWAFVTVGQQGQIRRIDISDPSSMTRDGSVYQYAFANGAQGASISPDLKNLTYASDQWYVMGDVDVYNNSFTHKGSGGFGQYPYRTAWKNNTDVYMVGNTRLYKYSYDPNGVAYNYFHTNTEVNGNEFRNTRDIAINAQDDKAYIVSGTTSEGRFHVMDISGNNFSRNSTLYWIGETVTSVTFDPLTYLCYVVDETEIKVVDVSSTPTLVSTFTPTGGNPYYKYVTVI